MSSDRSVLNKIRLALMAAQQTQPNSPVDLHRALKQTAFYSRQYDIEADEWHYALSSATVRRTVGLCSLLGLIDDRGRLASAGRQALKHERFEIVVGQRARLVLESTGVDLDRLNRVIRRALSADPVELPTTRFLYAEVADTIRFSLFTRLVNLCLQTGAMIGSRKHLVIRC
jgi:hypothetical protein